MRTSLQRISNIEQGTSNFEVQMHVRIARFVKLGVVRVYMGRVRAVREPPLRSGTMRVKKIISNPVFTRTGIQQGISNVEGKDYRFLFPCSKSRE